MRRFPLIVGSTLLLYSVAGVQAKSSVELGALGLRFDVARPGVLSAALVAVALWAMARYAYYGMILTISPMRARRNLRHGNLQQVERSQNCKRRHSNVEPRTLSLGTTRLYSSASGSSTTSRQFRPRL
jgi:hypothetical protein